MKPPSTGATFLKHSPNFICDHTYKICDHKVLKNAKIDKKFQKTLITAGSMRLNGANFKSFRNTQ